MRDVIVIDTDSQTMRRKKYFVRVKPSWCRFPVIGLPWEILPFHTCNVARQSRSLVGTHIQLLEFDALEKTQMGFTLTKPSGFLFFLLRGEVRFFDEHGVPASHAIAPTYYLVYNSEGKFTVHMEKGQHTLLVIALDADWFIPSIENAHPAFLPLLEVWSARIPNPVLLPQKEITTEVWKTLGQLRMAVVENMDDGLTVLKYISKCMNIYHAQLIDQKELNRHADLEKGELLKEYLSANYMLAEECRTERILVKLGWTRWVLRNVEKNALGCTVGEYVRKLRIEKAVELLLNSEKKIYDIAIEVGFASSAVFIRVFKQFMGIAPTSYRKTNT